ncbi:2'-5' RNA ligase family protein [Brevibacterium samyangense]|uniref:2'-5' RNA ligase family protein n=1 Tax=Brevibacterium samyangense TaxID=366888 RepID=A0ABP5F0B1_9MICO
MTASFAPQWGPPPGAPTAPEPDENGMVSIGVTLELPEPFAGQLRRVRLGFGDEAARTVPAHITVIPPMEIPVHSWPVVREEIRRVANETSPFVIRLRGTGTFLPTSPVVFIAVARGIVECEQLSARLRTGVLNQPLSFPYHPHVTIAQGLPEPVLDEAFESLADFDASFMVHGFGVYFHGTSVGEDGVSGSDEEWELFDRVPFGP